MTPTTHGTAAPGARVRVALESDRVEAGGKLRGAVVLADGVEARRGVTPSLMSRLTQVGNPPKHRALVDMHLDPGDVVAGRVPFTLDVPPGTPFGFDAVVCDLQHYVRARVRGAWPSRSLDAIAAVDVRPRVVAHDRLAIEAAAASAPAPPSGLASDVGIVLVTLFGLPVVGPLLLYRHARRLLFARLASDFAVEVPERALVLGERVPVTLEFRPRRRLQIEHISVRLRGRAHWQSGGVKRTSHNSREFFTSEAVVEGGVIDFASPGAARRGAYREVAGGASAPASRDDARFVWRPVLTLPVSGHPALATGETSYEIVATVELRGAPTAERTLPLRTASARLGVALPQAEPEAIEATSRGIAFEESSEVRAPRPASRPKTVDAPWPGLVVLGIALAAGSAAPFSQRARGGGYVMLAVGLVLFAVGVVGHIVSRRRLR